MNEQLLTHSAVVPDPLPPSRPLPPPPREEPPRSGKSSAAAPAPQQPQRASQMFKTTDLDAIAAQLSELGAAARPNGKPMGPALLPSAASATSAIDQAAESDSDEDDDGRVRNDGTLLASDPPKPL
jgi:TRAF2/NCK-interacting kinase